MSTHNCFLSAVLYVVFGKPCTCCPCVQVPHSVGACCVVQLPRRAARAPRVMWWLGMTGPAEATRQLPLAFSNMRHAGLVVVALVDVLYADMRPFDFFQAFYAPVFSAQCPTVPCAPCHARCLGVPLATSGHHGTYVLSLTLFSTRAGAGVALR